MCGNSVIMNIMCASAAQHCHVIKSSVQATRLCDIITKVHFTYPAPHTLPFVGVFIRQCVSTAMCFYCRSLHVALLSAFLGGINECMLEFYSARTYKRVRKATCLHTDMYVCVQIYCLAANKYIAQRPAINEKKTNSLLYNYRIQRIIFCLITVKKAGGRFAFSL